LAPHFVSSTEELSFHLLKPFFFHIFAGRKMLSAQKLLDISEKFAVFESFKVDHIISPLLLKNIQYFQRGNANLMSWY